MNSSNQSRHKCVCPKPNLLESWILAGYLTSSRLSQYRLTCLVMPPSGYRYIGKFISHIATTTSHTQPPPDLLEICLNVHLVFESILPVVRYIQSTVTIARRLPTKELLSLSLLLLLLRILTFTTAKIEVSVIHLEL